MFGWVEAKSEVFTPPSTIIGAWEGHTIEMGGVASTNYSFIFSRDSFWLRKDLYNDVPVACVNSRTWKEYAKGTLGRKADTLLLEGNYTDSHFVVNPDMQLSDNCGAARVGVFKWRPRFALSSEDTLFFKEEFQDIAFHKATTGTIRKNITNPSKQSFRLIKKGKNLAVIFDDVEQPASLIEVFGINGVTVARKVVSSSAGAMGGSRILLDLPAAKNFYTLRITTAHGFLFGRIPAF
jgi:hypothetical protein